MSIFTRDQVVDILFGRLSNEPIERVVAIVGATGVGKSSIAEAVARALDAEIVSADSMQVYRGMDIGTAKVPVGERGVPYHCLDLVDPGQPYSASLYQRDARAAIEDIHARGKRAIVCGGTGLYVRAALDDMRFPAGEQVANPVRERYERIAEEEGPERLHAMLAEIDPESAALIHPNNVRRVVRAFEMLDEGVSYAEQNSGFDSFKSFYDTLYFGLTMETDRLYAAIDQRVDAMMEAGLLDEVAGLVKQGFADAITSSQAIGYKEFLPVLTGEGSLVDAIESVKRSTRRYSKRQRTWFKRDPRIEWFEVGEAQL